jgi:hypothetical protein
MALNNIVDLRHCICCVYWKVSFFVVKNGQGRAKLKCTQTHFIICTHKMIFNLAFSLCRRWGSWEAGCLTGQNTGLGRLRSCLLTTYVSHLAQCRAQTGQPRRQGGWCQKIRSSTSSMPRVAAESPDKAQKSPQESNGKNPEFSRGCMN